MQESERKTCKSTGLYCAIRDSGAACEQTNCTAVDALADPSLTKDNMAPGIVKGCIFEFEVKQVLEKRSQRSQKPH